MIADVVAWDVRKELPFDELTEAVQWVIEQQFLTRVAFEGVSYIKGLPPKVHITPCPPRQVNLPRGGNSNMPVATYWEHAVVVTNEPCTPEKATELWDQYEANLVEEEVDD